MSCCGGHGEEQVQFGSYSKCENCGMALSSSAADGQKCFLCGWSPEEQKRAGEVGTAEATKKNSKPPKHAHSHSDGESCKHSHGAKESEIEQSNNSPKVVARRPSRLRKLISFILVVTWLTIALGRVEIFKMRGKSISILDPVLESGLKVARPRGYSKQAETVLQLLGSPGTIPEAFHASKPHLKDLGKFWLNMKTEMEAASKRWVRDNKLKSAIPAADNGVPIASVLVFLSVFAAISFPKQGSMMFALAFITMYSVLNTYDKQLKVFDIGWIAFGAAALASILVPE